MHRGGSRRAAAAGPGEGGCGEVDGVGAEWRTKPRPGWAGPCAAAPPLPHFPPRRRAPPPPASPRSSARPRKTQRAARLRASCAEPRRHGLGSAARPEPGAHRRGRAASAAPAAGSAAPAAGRSGRPASGRGAQRPGRPGGPPEPPPRARRGGRTPGDANPRTLPRATRTSQGAALPVDAPTGLSPPGGSDRRGVRGVRWGGSRASHRNHMPFSLRAPWTPGLAWDYAGAVEASRPFPSGGPGSECLGDRAPLFWLRVSCVEINPCPSFFSPRAKEASNLGMGHLLPTPGQLQLSRNAG